jgi:hypothetical protein
MPALDLISKRFGKLFTGGFDGLIFAYSKNI